MSSFPNLHIIDHPLIQHKLTRMREKDCPTPEFKSLLHGISLLMGYEVLKSLPLKDKKIETPLEPMTGKQIAGQKLVVVPILRAGLGMSEAIMALHPEAINGHIGLYRDPKTKHPVEYLVKLPDTVGHHYLLVDPMLATGNSAVYAIDLLKGQGVFEENMSFMSLVAAPEGVEIFQANCPNVKLYTAALDRELNEKAYILPGLGDAGDRIFGT